MVENTEAAHRPWIQAFVALGANLGDAQTTVRQALQHLGGGEDIRVLHCSSLYRTAPVQADGPDFINAVAQISTRLTAPGLLRHLQALEAAAGRERPYPNAPRTLDLDLLLFGSARIESPLLTVPHPRMLQRAFVLVPLAEVAPEQVSPEQLSQVLHQAITRL